jgi:hypothetical protein
LFRCLPHGWAFALYTVCLGSAPASDLKKPEFYQAYVFNL